VVNLTQAGTFADKNVGTAKVVTAADTIAGTDFANYTLTQPTALFGNITAATLTYIANATTSIYGSTPVMAGGVVSGFVLGENQASATTGTLIFSTSATSASNIGSYAINGSGLTANNGNYVFVQAAGNATALTINPRIAIVMLNGTKVYDRTNIFSTSQLRIANVAGTDQVSLSAGTASTADANVGASKPFVSYSGLSLTGASASNYTLVGVTGSGTITAKALTVTGSVVAAKVYDGTTTATITGGALSGLIAGDVVTLTQAGTFVDKNVGTAKVVTATDVIAGAGATNYTLTQPTGLVGNITPRALVLTGTRLAGSTTVAANVLSVANLVAGDALTLGGSVLLVSGVKGVRLIRLFTTLTLTGASANNYTITGASGSVTLQ